MISSSINKIFLKAALITGCFFVFACSNNYQEVQDLAKKKTMNDQAINVESYLSEDGILKAKLTSPLMIMQNAADTTTTLFPKTLHVDFFDDSTRIQSKLFAKYGLYYNNSRLVFLKDSVVVFNTQGDTLRCEKLWWNQNTQLIYTDVPVHIRKPDESIDGTGLVADQNFSHWTISNAKGPINVPDSTLPSD